MFHFRRRIAFRVDVGDFLELERAFERRRERVAAAEEEEVFRRCILRGEFLDRVVLLEQSLDLLRGRFKGLENIQRAPGGQHAHPAQMYAEEREDGEGGDERLGGGDADFRPSVHVNAPIGFAGNGAPHDVDDGERPMTAAPGLAQRGQRVRRFTGLRDDEQHRVFFQRRVAITKLVRELDFHRQVREFLDEILADERRVPARAARRDHDAINAAEFRRAQVQAPKPRCRAFVIHATAEGVLHRARLLKDFLEHEVRVFAPLGIFGLKLKLADLHLGGVRPEIQDVKPLARDGGHVVVVQKNHLARVRHNGVGIAGQKIFPIANADDQRRTTPRTHHHFRLFGADHRDAVRADDFAERVAHGLGERIQLRLLPAAFRVMLPDQVREHFRIGAGMKLVPGLEQALFELIVVFNDAVVNDGDLAGLVEVRMGILITRWTVRGPAGVGNAGFARCRVGDQFAGDALVNLALFLADQQVRGMQHGNSRAVIATIFQPTQSLQQDGRGRFLTDVSNNSAHELPISVSEP